MKKFIKHLCVFAMLVCTLFTITACGAKIEGISIDTEATYEFFVGETVNPSIIKVYADYSNNTKTLLPLADIEITGIDTTTAGARKFTVKYQDYVIEVNYVVYEVEVASISLDATSVTKECFVGDNYYPTGLQVTAIYNNGETRLVNLADVTVDTLDTETAGTKMLTVTYAGKTATLPIVVKAVELETITVDSTNMKTEYFVGETIDTTGLVVKAVYNNGSETALAFADVDFGTVDMTTAGTKNMVVTYQQKTATVEINVVAIELVEIEAISSAMKTVYNIGETFDTTGLVVNKVFNNGTREQIALSDANLVISPVDTTTAGEKVVTITYQGKTTTIEITVSEDSFANIEVDSTNMKTEYYAGDTLDTTGLVVKAVYESGNKVAVALNLVSFSNVDLTTVGEKILTVTYNGKTQDITITVVAVVMTDLTVDYKNMKVEYYQGDTLDTTGLVITATYNNGKTATIAHADATFDNYDMTIVGTQYLMVVYGDKVKTIEITVLALVLESISVNAQSMKTQYFVGDEVDTTGLVVKAHYNSGKVVTLSLSEVTFSTVDMTTAGEKTLTVTYNEKTQNVAITVVAVEPTGIIVDTTEMKTNYLVGEVIDETGLKVSLKYNNQTTTEVELEDVQLSEVDMSTEGTKVLTISYLGYNANVNIYVTAPETDDWYVIGYELPSFVATYQTNKAEKANKETEYFDRTQTYKVGTDNEFVFNPIVTALKDPFDDDEIESVLTTYRHMFKIYIQTGSTYQELTADFDMYVESIDERNGRIQFTQQAQGHTFKVEAKPYYFQDEDDGFVVSFIFDVVSGYNIYDEKELAIIDNVQTDKWKEFKQENDLENISVNKIIFHNNLVLTDSDLAKTFFYQEDDEDTKALISKYPQIVGSLRDWMSLYHRKINNGETFEIEGNYYTLDCSKVSVIQYFGGEGAMNQMTHSQMFMLEGEFVSAALENEAQSREQLEDLTTDTYTFKNFSVIGNANRDEDTSKAGGLIFVKSPQTMLNATNILTRGVAITWFPDSLGSMNLDKVKSYDTYSTSIYGYRRTNITITNSEIKRSGGPLIISGHEASDELPWHYGVFDIDENTTIEAFVTGQEAWFESMGVAAQVAMLTAVEPLIQGYSALVKNPRTMFKNVNGVDQFNCVFGVYDAANLLSAGDDTKGYIQIGDFELDLTGNDVVLATYRTMLSQLPTIPPILQCGGVTMFLYTEDGVNYSLKQLGGEGFVDPSSADVAQFFTGKYLTFVIYGGLAVVVELF